MIPDECSGCRAELSETEASVLECLLAGMTRARIATALGVSENDVAAHTRALLEKLQVPDRSSLIAAATGALSVNADGKTPENLYRLCLNGNDEVAWIDLPLNGEKSARWAAGALADACSEVYREYALWHGTRLLHQGPVSATSSFDIPEMVMLETQKLVIEREEALQASRKAVSKSRRLLAMTHNLREAIRPASM